MAGEHYKTWTKEFQAMIPRDVYQLRNGMSFFKDQGNDVKWMQLRPGLGFKKDSERLRKPQLTGRLGGVPSEDFEHVTRHFNPLSFGFDSIGLPKLMTEPYEHSGNWRDAVRGKSDLFKMEYGLAGDVGPQRSGSPMADIWQKRGDHPGFASTAPPDMLTSTPPVATAMEPEASPSDCAFDGTLAAPPLLSDASATTLAPPESVAPLFSEASTATLAAPESQE